MKTRIVVIFYGQMFGKDLIKNCYSCYVIVPLLVLFQSLALSN